MRAFVHRADEDAVDVNVPQRRPRLERHVCERALDRRALVRVGVVGRVRDRAPMGTTIPGSSPT